jgi:hypothetical protein
MDRACSTHGEKRNAYMISVGKPEGKGLLVRTRRRCEENTKLDLSDIERGHMDLIHLAQDREH